MQTAAGWMRCLRWGSGWRAPASCSLWSRRTTCCAARRLMTRAGPARSGAAQGRAPALLRPLTPLGSAVLQAWPDAAGRARAARAAVDSGRRVHAVRACAPRGRWQARCSCAWPHRCVRRGQQVLHHLRPRQQPHRARPGPPRSCRGADCERAGELARCRSLPPAAATPCLTSRSQRCVRVQRDAVPSADAAKLVAEANGFPVPEAAGPGGTPSAPRMSTPARRRHAHRLRGAHEGAVGRVDVRRVSPPPLAAASAALANEAAAMSSIDLDESSDVDALSRLAARAAAARRRMGGDVLQVDAEYP